MATSLQQPSAEQVAFIDSNLEHEEVQDMVVKSMWEIERWTLAVRNGSLYTKGFMPTHTPPPPAPSAAKSINGDNDTASSSNGSHVSSIFDTDPEKQEPRVGSFLKFRKQLPSGAISLRHAHSYSVHSDVATESSKAVENPPVPPPEEEDSRVDLTCWPPIPDLPITIPTFRAALEDLAYILTWEQFSYFIRTSDVGKTLSGTVYFPTTVDYRRLSVDCLCDRPHGRFSRCWNCNSAICMQCGVDILNKHCRLTCLNASLSKPDHGPAGSVAALRVVSSCGSDHCSPPNVEEHCNCMEALLDATHDRITHCEKCASGAVWELGTMNIRPIPPQGSQPHWEYFCPCGNMANPALPRICGLCGKRCAAVNVNPEENSPSTSGPTPWDFGGEVNQSCGKWIYEVFDGRKDVLDMQWHELWLPKIRAEWRERELRDNIDVISGKHTATTQESNETKKKIDSQ